MSSMSVTNTSEAEGHVSYDDVEDPLNGAGATAKYPTSVGSYPAARRRLRSCASQPFDLTLSAGG